MAYVDQGDPDLLVFRSGGGLLTLFGLPFLLAGLFVIALTLGLVSIEGDVPPLAFGLPFGGIFAAVGAGKVVTVRYSTVSSAFRALGCLLAAGCGGGEKAKAAKEEAGAVRDYATGYTAVKAGQEMKTKLKTIEAERTAQMEALLNESE